MKKPLALVAFAVVCAMSSHVSAQGLGNPTLYPSYTLAYSDGDDVFVWASNLHQGIPRNVSQIHDPTDDWEDTAPSLDGNGRYIVLRSHRRNGSMGDRIVLLDLWIGLHYVGDPADYVEIVYDGPWPIASHPDISRDATTVTYEAGVIDSSTGRVRRMNVFVRKLTTPRFQEWNVSGVAFEPIAEVPTSIVVYNKATLDEDGSRVVFTGGIPATFPGVTPVFPPLFSALGWDVLLDEAPAIPIVSGVPGFEFLTYDDADINRAGNAFSVTEMRINLTASYVKQQVRVFSATGGCLQQYEGESAHFPQYDWTRLGALDLDSEAAVFLYDHTEKTQLQRTLRYASVGSALFSDCHDECFWTLSNNPCSTYEYGGRDISPATNMSPGMNVSPPAIGKIGQERVVYVVTDDGQKIYEVDPDQPTSPVLVVQGEGLRDVAARN